MPSAAAPKRAAMVIDVHTGRHLHKNQINRSVYPASLTKLMTVYLVFEAIEKKQAAWSTRITISPFAAAKPPSKLGLKSGQSITLRTAVRALIVKSANDIAAAVAENLAGSEVAFARRMTRKARALGMHNTVFRNASGLPDRHQTTTANDMIKLALRLFDDYPQHFHLFRLRRFIYKGRVFRSHNGLLRRFPGTDGMKTGYTRASGFNLIASVRRNRRHVIGVVFGGPTSRKRNAKMRRLITKALKKASPVRSRLREKPHLIAALRPHKRKQRIARTKPNNILSTVELRRRRLAARRAPSLHTVPTAKPARMRVAPIRVARVRAIDIRSRRHTVSSQKRVVASPPQAQIKAPRAYRRELPPPRLIAPPAPVRYNSAPRRQTTFHGNGRTRTGRPPSTLDAQAFRLANPGKTTLAPKPVFRWTYRRRRSALGGTPSVRSYHVQIGAYISEIDARNRLNQVQTQFPALLQDARQHASWIQGRRRRIFRARFIGFDVNAANRTCNELRRHAVKCLVVRSK